MSGAKLSGPNLPLGLGLGLGVREAPFKLAQKIFGLCPDGLLRQLWHLKKVPKSARLSAGEGVQKPFGQ